MSDDSAKAGSMARLMGAFGFLTILPVGHRAAYDPVMPPVATDPTHALRLAARVGKEMPV